MGVGGVEIKEAPNKLSELGPSPTPPGWPGATPGPSGTSCGLRTFSIRPQPARCIEELPSQPRPPPVTVGGPGSLLHHPCQVLPSPQTVEGSLSARWGGGPQGPSPELSWSLLRVSASWTPQKGLSLSPPPAPGPQANCKLPVHLCPNQLQAPPPGTHPVPGPCPWAAAASPPRPPHPQPDRLPLVLTRCSLLGNAIISSSPAQRS